MRRETFGKTVFGPNPASRKILRFENRRAEGADEARRLVVADGIQLLERQAEEVDRCSGAFVRPEAAPEDLELGFSDDRRSSGG